MLSDLLQGTAAEAVHFQGDAGPLGQLGDRRDHPPKLLPGDRFVFRRGRLVGDARRELLYVPGRVAVFQGQAPPSVMRRCLVAKPCFLNHIFRLCGVADDAVGIARQGTAMGDK